MIILYWLKLPSSVSKIAPIERLLLRISRQMRTISSQPKFNQTYPEIPSGSSEQVMIILYWLKLASSVSKIAPIERLLLRISKQMRTVSAQLKSNPTYSVLPKETL